MSETLIFSEAAQALLAPFNFDGPATEPGYRRLRRAAVSSSSDDAAWEHIIEIPDQLNSIQALRFVGFKRIAARTILDRFESALTRERETNIPFDLYSFITGFLDENPYDAYNDDHDWNEAMTSLGVRKAIREGILCPDSHNIRMTKSAKAWVSEIFQERWWFLTSADKTVKKNKKKIQDAFTKNGAGIRAKRRSEMGAENDEDTISPSYPVTTATSAQLEDHTRVMMYKGGSLVRFEKAFSETGQLNLFNLLSTPPTEFSRFEPWLYLTKQYQCAWEYAKFAEERSPELGACIFQISIPKELLASPREVVDEEWRRLVFTSRCGQDYDQYLAMKLEYEADKILVGPICGISTEQCEALNSPSEIKPMALFTGVKASQHVVKSGERMQEIQKTCEGRAALEIVAAKKVLAAKKVEETVSLTKQQKKKKKTKV